MNLTELVAGSIEGQRTALRVAESLTDEQCAAPSTLPGWSRAHVIAHLAGNTLAQTRQIDYALRGLQIEVYDGGPPTRAADIERRSGLPRPELTELLRDAHSAWEVAVAQVDDRIAAEPVAYRDGSVTNVIEGRWMESLVHAADLALSAYTWRDWPAPFCGLLLGYLSERLPVGQRVRLEATDAPYDETFGPDAAADTPDVHLRGPIADLAGYLADRAPASGVESLAAPLAELGPYPRGSVRR